jgi:signal transduction histidine kinase
VKRFSAVFTLRLFLERGLLYFWIANFHFYAPLTSLPRDTGTIVMADKNHVVLPGTDIREVSPNRRERIEGALVDVSRILIAGGEPDLQLVLKRMGEAVWADSAYFLLIPLDHEIAMASETSMPEMKMAVWHRTPERVDWRPPSLDALATRTPIRPQALAVPILSAEDRLYGYLGFEYGSSPPKDMEQEIRVLGLLGDLFAAYFERRQAEQRLEASEDRYRTFVETISEGIFRIEFEDAVLAEQAPEALVEAIVEHGVVAECNSVVYKFFGRRPTPRRPGVRLSNIVGDLERLVLEDLVTTGFHLTGRPHTIMLPDGQSRHVVVNAVGTISFGRLVHIWGSFIDVTQQVELEYRMVSALEDQQQRIGHDLHDGVGQLLTGIRMLSRNLCDRYFDSEDEGSAQAKRIARFAEQASERVRDIYRGLTPVLLFEEGLAVALEELAHHTDMLPGISCQFVHDRETEINDRDVRLHLYRIAQEAVNNALKHAQAASIRVSLATRGRRVHLEISDDGIGFDIEAVRRRQKTSLGMNSMEYRAKTIKSRLTIESSPRGGTRVRAVINAAVIAAAKSTSSNEGRPY